MPIFFRYKMRFVTVALLIGYTFLHTKLTGIYVDADLGQLIDYTVRLPFAQRVLVPTVAHKLQQFLPLRTDEVFFLLECFFVSLFYFSICALLKTSFDKKQTQVLAWLFILLLPLMSVINYRHTMGGAGPFSYPWDSASLLFMSLGFLFCLQKRWFLYVPLIFLATFNRESSILLVLLIPTLHWREGARILKPFLCAAFTYAVAHFMVLYSIEGSPGSLVEWYYGKGSHTNFEVNLVWLLDQNIFMFPFCFLGLPIFWFAFYDYIPAQYRPIRYLTFFYFLGLVLVGNLSEARIFTEIIVLLYLPVCLALSRWLNGLPAYPLNGDGVVFYLDRYALLAVLTAIVIFRNYLNQFILLAPRNMIN